MSKPRFNLIAGATQLVDVMFLADATGSMGPCLANVQSNMLTAWSNFQTSTNWDVAVGVSFYRDSMDAVPFQILQQITTNTQSVQNAVNLLAAIGGGDTPEGQLGGLALVAPRTGASGWRPGAIRIVAWFGDQPGHDPYTLNGTTYSLTNPSSPNVNPISVLQEYGVQVCAFSMNTGFGGNQLDATGQATQVTQACSYDNEPQVSLNVSITNVAATIFSYLQGEI